jgi:t-SNARE complex subunit (syntaxin)
MISILLLLLLLSLTLFLYNQREGLDNCPPIDGTTTAGLNNSANLSSIEKHIDNINQLKEQIDKNTSTLDTINIQLKDSLDIKKKVNDLTKQTTNLQNAMKNLGNNMQSNGFAVAGTSKKDLPNPLPNLTDDPNSGKQRTE